MKRVSSSSADVRRKTDRFRALRGDPAATRAFALEIIQAEANPELLAAALRALGESVRIEDGPALRDLYQYFAEAGRKRDAGGQIRAAALSALWHLRDRDDVDLAREAVRTLERTFQGNGELIRAAGLALLGVLDLEEAKYAAIHILGTGDAAEMSGEPALTAVRLLANLDEPGPLALFVTSSDRGVLADLLAEAFRGLVTVPAVQLHDLILLYLPDAARHDRPRHLDDVAMLGLCDLLVALDLDPVVARAVQYFLSVSSLDVYAVFATSIVASRRTELIALFLGTFGTETSQPRLRIALDALRHAPQTPEVEAAIASLHERTTRGPTLADLADTFDDEEEDLED